MNFKKLVLMMIATAFIGCGSAAKSSSTESAAAEPAAEEPAAEEPAAEESAAEEPAATGSVDTSDIKILSGQDPNADLANYKTYAWAGAEAAISDPAGKWSMPDLNIANEIIFLVNRELRERGMTEVAENPDVLLTCAVVVDMDALATLKDPESDFAFIKTIPQGALVVAFTDPATEEALWIGAATAEIKSSQDNEFVKARLDYVVRNIAETLNP